MVSKKDECTRRAVAGKPFREIATFVYYARGTDGALQKNNAALDQQVIHTAMTPGKTAGVITFSIGLKFDSHMSLEDRMQRKFGEFDAALGASILSHPGVLTWLKRSTNALMPVRSPCSCACTPSKAT